MQLDKRKSTAPSVNQMAFDMMIEDQRRPAPYRLAPAAATTTSTSAAAGYPPSSTFTRSLTPLSHLDGYGRKSTDTPLSMYAMHRAKYKMTVLSSLLSPRQHSQTVQVPLSALSSAKVRPGAVGGSFNSTSKMKCIPLPSIYDHNQVTKRGIRNITLHSERYTPSFRSGNRTRTISDSLLHLSEPTRQKNHLLDRESDVHRSRSLKKAREVIPHRLERAFYMNGHSAQFFNRQDLTAEELSTLQAISLSHNRDLFYGRGMRSSRMGNRGPRKAVEKFQNQLREATEEEPVEYDDFSIDMERVHRVSRAVTPAVTIPEENATEVEEEERERRKSGETFITESQSRVGNCNERTDC